MNDHAKNLFGEAMEDMSVTTTTTSAEHILEVRDSLKLLNENINQYFHTMIAKLLFFSKIARPNILESVA